MDLNQIIAERQLAEENLNRLLGNILTKNFILSGTMIETIISID